MTPAARVAAAITILDEIVAGHPAERCLTAWARASRFAGSRDRAAVRDLVFDALRRRRSALWRSGQETETGRALVTGLLADLSERDALFDGSAHGPSPLSAAEAHALRPLEGAPRPVRLDVPDFLEEELERSLEGALEPALEVLRSRAEVHLRVNTLKATREAAMAVLVEDEIEVEALPGPTALRVTRNPRRVAASRAYRDGLVELQDAASQAAAAAAAVVPGMTVLDLCAGGGGKTLALGAAMAAKGRLYAYDLYPARMKSLPERARRAGLSVSILDRRELPRILGSCDVVFVDAPCSGSGAWRRSPDAKWRLTPDSLAALVAVQKRLAAEALGYLRPGGHAVYATCSLLSVENAGVLSGLQTYAGAVAVSGETRLLPSPDQDGFFFATLKQV
ncbi:MAG: RsmB/NOP family class I SAM-dependent RNA methyltransferase [Pseudomonadota bacterium]